MAEDTNELPDEAKSSAPEQPKYREVSEEELKRILADHREWLDTRFEKDVRGKRADLSRADLQGANLERANLQGANLKRANLQGANLTVANLERADLRDANLERAILFGANLQRASLSGANLQGAGLIYANLAWRRLEGGRPFAR